MKLAFFTSLGFGLEAWDRLGTLSRELALYNKLAESGWTVHIFTYEREKDISALYDLECLRRFKVHTLLPNVIPRCMRKCFLLFLPFVIIRYALLANGFDVVKTNQGHSGIHALIFALIFNIPLVSRSGYVLSEQLCNRNDWSLKDIVRAFLERITMRWANACIVPTQFLFDWCKKNMKCRDIFLLPNIVNCDKFQPCKACKSPSFDNTLTIISVGRLSVEKRFNLLIQAVGKRAMKVVIVGDGILRTELMDQAKREHVTLEIIGRIANEKLPVLLSSSDVFVICSEYEGHPKALIEAMACGCACIGTNSPGIMNQIKDGENGLLVEGSAEGIFDGIQRLLSDKILVEKIKKGARKYALENFSLENLAVKEDLILRNIAREGARR